MKMTRGPAALVVAALMVGLVFGGSGCAKSTAQNKIRMADQFGLGYAPVTIMLEKKFIEKRLPGVTIERLQFGSGGAVREAMVAGQLDVGFVGIPPFLIGWDKGVDWKIAGALDQMTLLLMAPKDKITSLKDFKAKDKIALPGPGSNQHIILAMAAEKELGKATALDNNIVAMPHPDATAALMAGKGDISAYFGAPPYQNKLQKQANLGVVVDGFDAFGGPFSYIVAVAGGRFYKEQPKAYKAFVGALEDALAFMRENPKEAAAILAAIDKRTSADDYQSYLTAPRTAWDITPRGVMRYATAMQQYGYIKKVPASWTDVCFPNLHKLKGD